MASSKRVLVLSVGITRDSSRGVAVAQYSHMHSRMWAWDARTLEVLGSQDVKAAVRLLDTNRTGELCAYHATSYESVHSGQPLEVYIAISKPPYFSALLIRNTAGLEDTVRFESDRRIRLFQGRIRGTWGGKRDVRERIEPHCPFQIEPYGDSKIALQNAARVTVDHLYGSRSEAWASVDPEGRTIQLIGQSLCADEEPFIDMSRGEFVQVPPPDWAKRW